MLTALEKAEILNKVIAKLGNARATEASQPAHPPVANPTGFDGVDELPSGKYRARIRFCNALNGSDVRPTLGSYQSAEQAGYAYALAHLRLWGDASRFA